MAAPASATGIGVSPSSLEFVVEEGSQSSRQLILHNTGIEEAGFTLSSNSEMLKVWPKTVEIPGNGRARATVTASGTKAGKISAELLVEAAGGGGSDVSLSLGTSIIARINVIKASAAANALVGASISTGIVALGVSAYLAFGKKLLEKGTNFI